MTTTAVATAAPRASDAEHRQILKVMTGLLAGLFTAILFVAGSVGAGLSQTVPPMMAFRALQGLAMGGLVALTRSIMGALIPPRQRGRYSGYMGAVTS